MATPAPVAPPPTTTMSHGPACASSRRYISARFIGSPYQILRFVERSRGRRGGWYKIIVSMAPKRQARARCCVACAWTAALALVGTAAAQNTKPLVDCSREELTRAVPELAGMQFDSNQNPLGAPPPGTGGDLGGQVGPLGGGGAD